MPPSSGRQKTKMQCPCVCVCVPTRYLINTVTGYSTWSKYYATRSHSHFSKFHSVTININVVVVRTSEVGATIAQLNEGP
jgi:hypothetical protein